MPLIERRHFELAIANIAGLGDTDVFPLPIENHVLFDMKKEAVDLLMEMAKDLTNQLILTPPINYSALAPVGYEGFRWATQIDPIWNAYMLGLTLSLAADIEAKRAPSNVVFSHRYAPDGEHLFHRTGWREFQAESERLAGQHKYVVSVDIADFYGRIYHHRIENVLRYVDPDGQRTSQIINLLKTFSDGVSYGLPVGGPASRILSELLLNEADSLLAAMSPTLSYTRYADDYRFFVDSHDEAYRAIGFLSDRLRRNEGLSLQRSKTRIMTSSEYLASNKPSDPRPGSAAKFLNLHLYYDPYSPTAEEDYEDLREQLNEFDVLGMLRAELHKGRIDQALTKKLVGALHLMKPLPKEQAITSLLENLETLAPIIPHVMRAIRDNVSELTDEAQDRVHERVRLLISEGHRLSRVDVNLAYMIRVLARRRSIETEHLLMQIYDGPHGYGGAANPAVQRDIILVLGKWRANHWLHDRRSHYPTSHAWVKRAFLVASFSLGDEGSHWRRANRPLLQPFDGLTLAWAASRQAPAWEIPI